MDEHAARSSAFVPIAINNAGYSYINYKESRVVGYEDQVKTDKDRKSRAA